MYFSSVSYLPEGKRSLETMEKSVNWQCFTSQELHHWEEWVNGIFHIDVTEMVRHLRFVKDGSQSLPVLLMIKDFVFEL